MRKRRQKLISIPPKKGTTVTWTEQKLRRFKEVVRKADADGTGPYESFEFEGLEFILSYAKHLIKYIESQR